MCVCVTFNETICVATFQYLSMSRYKFYYSYNNIYVFTKDTFVGGTIADKKTEKIVNVHTKPAFKCGRQVIHTYIQTYVHAAHSNMFI